MREEGLVRIVVASAGSDLVAGTIGEVDVLRSIVDGTTDGIAADVMSLDPPSTVRATDSLDAAVALMRTESLDFLLVLDGALSVSDVAAYMARG